MLGTRSRWTPRRSRRGSCLERFPKPRNQQTTEGIPTAPVSESIGLTSDGKAGLGVEACSHPSEVPPARGMSYSQSSSRIRIWNPSSQLIPSS